MEYRKEITLKDGRPCVLRTGTEEDARAVLDNFILTHAQTDYLLSLPEEIRFTVEQEAKYLQKKAEAPLEIELLAEVDGLIVGTAGFEPVSTGRKVRHRASFGISVDRAYWGLGIGRAMTESCIECARKAGFSQLELEVVSDNRAALALYESAGFAEFGRNPRGFGPRGEGWRELVLMRLELTE